MKALLKLVLVSFLVAVVIMAPVFLISHNQLTAAFLGLMGAYLYIGKEISFKYGDATVEKLFKVNKLMLIALTLFIIFSIKTQAAFAILGGFILLFLLILELLKKVTEVLSGISQREDEYYDYSY